MASAPLSIHIGDFDHVHVVKPYPSSKKKGSISGYYYYIDTPLIVIIQLSPTSQTKQETREYVIEVNQDNVFAKIRSSATSSLGTIEHANFLGCLGRLDGDSQL